MPNRYHNELLRIRFILKFFANYYELGFEILRIFYLAIFWLFSTL